jgi:hypothetical protein
MLQFALKPKLGPQCPLKLSRLELGRELNKDLQMLVWLWRRKTCPKKLDLLLSKHLLDLDFIIRHASGKRLSEEEIAEAKHYARELKYPKGALVYNGTDEDDFL